MSEPRDAAEQQARKFLEGLGHRDICHEPDGIVASDFLLDGRIAVEVTRLVEHRPTDSGPKPVDRLAWTIARDTERLLEEFGPTKDGKCWFVDFTVRRPVRGASARRRCFKRYLQDFLAGGPNRLVEEDIEISIFAASACQGPVFRLGGFDDPAMSGWTGQALILAIEAALAKKAEVRGAATRPYPEWWLILVDTIAYGGHPIARAEINVPLEIVNLWDQIRVIGSCDAVRWFII